VLCALRNIIAKLEQLLHSVQQDVYALRVHQVYLQMIRFVPLVFIAPATPPGSWHAQLAIGVHVARLLITVFHALQDGLVKRNASAAPCHVQVVHIPQQQA